MGIDLSSDRLKGQGDDIYAGLLAAHEGLSAEQSAKLNARLIFLLANQLADPEAVMAAIKAAKAGL